MIVAKRNMGVEIHQSNRHFGAFAIMNFRKTRRLLTQLHRW